MRKLLFTLMSLVCSLAVAATVYRWVDEDGVVHYSDTPHTNAEKVQVESAQTYKSTGVPASSGKPSTPAPVPEAYQSCSIAQPTNDQTLMNVQSVTIVVHMDPALRAGDQIVILVDGQPVQGASPTSPTYTMPVDRGTHTAMATVKSSGGLLLCQSPGVTFHVQQPSLLSPINRPRPTPH